MRRRERQMLLLWLATTLVVLCACLFAYRGQEDAVGLASESFVLAMSILAFPTSVVFGLLVGAATNIPTLAAFSLHASAALRLSLDWAIGFGAGYVQYFVMLPILRNQWRKHSPLP